MITEPVYRADVILAPQKCGECGEAATHGYVAAADSDRKYYTCDRHRIAFTIGA